MVIKRGARLTVPFVETEMFTITFIFLGENEMEITIKIDEPVKNSIGKSEDMRSFSQYARFFDEACPGWINNPEYNLMFIRQQQTYANDLLKTKGYVFLNDVYEMLGMPKSKAGQVVGWIYDLENGEGDNYIDFGIYNLGNEQFVNGNATSILLDFNVDGMILDKI